MKSNLATMILLGVLAISAVSSVVLFLQYTAKTREMRSLQGTVSFINTRRAAINSLANDALKYSEKNPAIDPILVSAGVKASRVPATTAPKTTPGK